MPNSYLLPSLIKFCQDSGLRTSTFSMKTHICCFGNIAGLWRPGTVRRNLCHTSNHNTSNFNLMVKCVEKICFISKITSPTSLPTVLTTHNVEMRSAISPIFEVELFPCMMMYFLCGFLVRPPKPSLISKRTWAGSCFPLFFARQWTVFYLSK